MLERHSWTTNKSEVIYCFKNYIEKCNEKDNIINTSDYITLFPPLRENPWLNLELDDHTFSHFMCHVNKYHQCCRSIMTPIDDGCSSVITFTQNNKVLRYSCNSVRLSGVGNSLWNWQKSHLSFIAQLKLDQKTICFSSCVNSVYVITLSAWGGRHVLHWGV